MEETRKSMTELYEEWKREEINHENYKELKEAWKRLLK